MFLFHCVVHPQIFGNSLLCTVLDFGFLKREPEKVVQVVYLIGILRSIGQRGYEGDLGKQEKPNIREQSETAQFIQDL